MWSDLPRLDCPALARYPWAPFDSDKFDDSGIPTGIDMTERARETLAEALENALEA